MTINSNDQQSTEQSNTPSTTNQPVFLSPTIHPSISNTTNLSNLQRTSVTHPSITSTTTTNAAAISTTTTTTASLIQPPYHNILNGSFNSLNSSSSNQQNIQTHLQDDDEGTTVIETDPSGRFERYSVCLGRGAYKEVYKAFDQEEGVEVAWNQLRLENFQKTDTQRIISEIEILQSLRNEHIINLFYSWSSKTQDGKDHIYFITELMTSGTLKSYVRKTKGMIKPKVLKSWARQILIGLAYLHAHDPIIIHRDLKCDNIFINGNNGQAKIGDLGHATFKSKDHVSSVLGTPEFMAPELYDEMYDERVDIYAFGMVMLEIVTKEYPYSECTNQAQIYKKVTSNIKPVALSKIVDQETRAFIELCTQFDPEDRPSAKALLEGVFLNTESETVNTAVTTSPVITPSFGSFASHVPSFDLGGSGLTQTSQQQSHGNTHYPSPLATQPSIYVNVSTPMYPPQSAPIQQTPRIHTPNIITPVTLQSTYSTQSQPIQHLNRSDTITQTDSQTMKIENKPLIHILESSLHTYKITKSPSPNTHHALTVTLLSDSKTTLLLKMGYVNAGGKFSDITFPFQIEDDTATDVVREMVNEKLIDQGDEELARRKIEEIVRGVLIVGRSDRSLDAEEVKRLMHDRQTTPTPNIVGASDDIGLNVRVDEPIQKVVDITFVETPMESGARTTVTEISVKEIHLPDDHPSLKSSMCISDQIASTADTVKEVHILSNHLSLKSTMGISDQIDSTADTVKEVLLPAQDISPLKTRIDFDGSADTLKEHFIVDGISSFKPQINVNEISVADILPNGHHVKEQIESSPESLEPMTLTITDPITLASLLENTLNDKVKEEGDIQECVSPLIRPKTDLDNSPKSNTAGLAVNSTILSDQPRTRQPSLPVPVPSLVPVPVPVPVTCLITEPILETPSHLHPHLTTLPLQTSPTLTVQSENIPVLHPTAKESVDRRHSADDVKEREIDPLVQKRLEAMQVQCLEGFNLLHSKDRAAN